MGRIFILVVMLLYFNLSFAQSTEDCQSPSKDWLTYESRKTEPNFEFKSKEEFDADVEENIRDFCSCHYGPYLDSKLSAEEAQGKVMDKLRPCLQTSYCAKSKGMKNSKIRSTFSSSKVVCTKKDIKEWNSKYKEAEEAEDGGIDKLYLQVQKKHCGLPAEKESGTNKSEECSWELVEIIDAKAVNGIDKKCSSGPDGSSKKSKKLCIEKEKLNLLIAFDTNAVNSKELSPLLCKDEKLEGKSTCLDGIAVGFHDSECKTNTKLPTIEAKVLCGKIRLENNVGKLIEGTHWTQVEEKKKNKSTTSSAISLNDMSACLKGLAKDATNQKDCLLKPSSVKSEGESSDGSSGPTISNSDAPLTPEEAQAEFEKLNKEEATNTADASGNSTAPAIELGQTSGISLATLTSGEKSSNKSSNSTNTTEEKNSQIPEQSQKELKKKLKGKFSDAEIKSCQDAYKEAKKKNLSKDEDVKPLFAAKNCDVEKLVATLNGEEVKNPCYTEADKYKDEDYIFSKIKKACKMGAPKEDADALASCYIEGKKDKDEFLRCGQNIGCSENAAKCNKVKNDLVGKYDLKSVGQNLKEEFRVAGCEEEYRHYDVYKNEDRSSQMLHGPTKHLHEKEGTQIDCKENRNKCISGRVGQEAAKAILGELATNGEITKDLAKLLGIKNTQLVAATAALTSDALSCIPPKAVRKSWQSGSSVMTKASDYCNYLDANGWGDSSIASEDAKRRCLQEMNEKCSKYEGDENNKLEFNACCETVLGQVIQKEKANQSGNVLSVNQGDNNAQLQTNMTLGTSTTSDGKRQMNACLVGAGFSGISAFISAVCNDENKYPTSEKKEECLKKARFLNDAAGIGATVARCAANGPLTHKKGEKLTEEQEMAKRNVNDCLINGLGKQTIDILGRELNLNTKQKNLLDTGFNLTMGVRDCVRSQNKDLKLAEDPQAKACLAKVGINGAIDLINGQDLIKDPKLKNLAIVGLSVSGNLLACNGITDQKQRNMCAATGALQGLSKLDGPWGEVAGIGAQGLALAAGLQSCPPGDQLCLANALAAQIPGDAKDYIGMMVKGRSLFKQLKNPCQVPSIYLSSGGAVVNLAGDLVTHIMHKVQTEKLKKSYSDLVKAQKEAEKEDNLFNNIGSLIAGNDKKREEERAKELEEAQQAAPDAQVRAFEFAIKNEENQLSRSKITYQFQNVGMILNSASVIMAYVEQTMESTNTLTKSAYWKNCVKTQKPKEDETCNKGEKGSINNFRENVQNIVEYRPQLEINQIKRNNEKNMNLGYLSTTKSTDALALYVDQERYLQGELTSITTDFYKEIKLFDLDQDPKIGEAINFLSAIKNTFIPSAQAADFATYANLGFTMANGLFPGKTFDAGSPMGYAQNIVMLGVEEGLKKMCPPEDPATATKEVCKWQGGITFAARKITKAMLCTFDTEVNQFMRSGFGRGLVGGYVAYDYIKWQTLQKQQISQQEGRVKTMNEQLTSYKLQTGYNDFHLEKIQKMFKDGFHFFVLDEAHAAVKDSGYKVCVSKSGNADFSCSCQKSGCLRVFPQQQEGFRKNLGSINQKMGPNFSSVMNVVNWIAGTTDSLFNGSKSASDIDTQKIQKLNASLTQYGDKLAGVAAKVMLQNKETPVDKTRAFASLDNAIYKNVPKDLQNAIKGVAIGKLGPKYENTGKGPTTDSDLAEQTVAPIKADEVVPSEPISTSGENAETVAKVEDDSHMKKNYQYNKGNDISQDKDESIFKLINSRYNKVLDRKMLGDE